MSSSGYISKSVYRIPGLRVAILAGLARGAGTVGVIGIRTAGAAVAKHLVVQDVQAVSGVNSVKGMAVQGLQHCEDSCCVCSW